MFHNIYRNCPKLIKIIVLFYLKIIINFTLRYRYKRLTKVLCDDILVHNFYIRGE